MNLQSLVVVVLRLVSLNFLLQAAVQLTPSLLRFIDLYQRVPPDDSRSLFLLPWLVTIGVILSAVLLWAFALPIARLVTRSLPQDVSFGALSLVDCYSVAFIGIGLLYIASHLPQVLNWVHFLFTSAASDSGNSWKEGVRGYDISQAFIPFIVGIVLFVKGRSWAVALARGHEKTKPAKKVERTGAPRHGSDPGET